MIHLEVVTVNLLHYNDTECLRYDEKRFLSPQRKGIWNVHHPEHGRVEALELSERWFRDGLHEHQRLHTSVNSNKTFFIYIYI